MISAAIRPKYRRVARLWRPPVFQAIRSSCWALAFLLLPCSCYVEAHSVPPPPPPPEGGEVVYEAEPPPPPPAEVDVVPASPGPEFIWIAGYHHWDGRRYVWVRGRYERRPHPRARWVAPHWVVRGRAHVWVAGRWD
jgi:hypothetical protein